MRLGSQDKNAQRLARLKHGRDVAQFSKCVLSCQRPLCSNEAALFQTTNGNISDAAAAHLTPVHYHFLRDFGMSL